MRPTAPLIALTTLLLLAGCNSEKRDFVDACSGDDLTEAQCQCIYDLADEELSPSDRDAFVTTVAERGDAGDIFAGSDPGQSLFTGINLVGFMIEAQRQCVAGG